MDFLSVTTKYCLMLVFDLRCPCIWTPLEQTKISSVFQNKFVEDRLSWIDLYAFRKIVRNSKKLMALVPEAISTLESLWIKVESFPHKLIFFLINLPIIIWPGVLGGEHLTVLKADLWAVQSSTECLGVWLALTCK